MDRTWVTYLRLKSISDLHKTYFAHCCQLLTL
jgi:hypothetical protein